MRKVAVIMGSDSDLPVVTPCIETLRALDIPFCVRVLSAHRTPDAARAFACAAREEGFGALIAAAGKRAPAGRAGRAYDPARHRHPGLVLCAGRLDALLSTVQMPPGMPVATMAIDGGKNAALLAAQILSLSEPALSERLESLRAEMTAQVLAKDAKIQAQFES